MAGRFSSPQLYILRNEIEITDLMENILNIRFISDEGTRRFSCPICSGFNTGINTKTNLARCFGCKRNFNTIDIVIAHRKNKFIEAVKFLENHHNRPAKKQRISRPIPHKKSTQKDLKNESPESLGDILKDILPTKAPPIKPTSKDEHLNSLNLAEHIAELEHKVELMSSKLEKVQRLIISHIVPPPSSDQ